MTLIAFIVILIVAGILLFLIGRAPFIDAEVKVWIRWLIIGAIALFVIWALLSWAGVSIPNPRITK